MPNFPIEPLDDEAEFNAQHYEDIVGRWTSPLYAVQFASVETVPDHLDSEYLFDLSAWGISQSLRALLVDYSDEDIRSAVNWLAEQQNYIVTDALSEMVLTMRDNGQYIPRMQSLFVMNEADLFLPKGLRVPVTCVTNIVPRNQPYEAVDKFVAILDPAEAQHYIEERTLIDYLNGGLIH